MLGASLLMMSWQASESLVPVAIGAVIDRAIAPRDGRAAVVWLGILAALFLVLSMSFRFGSRLSRRASESAAHRTRVAIAAGVLQQGRALRQERGTGEALAIAGSDADRVGAFCAVLPRTSGALASLLVAAVVLLRISVPLGLVVLVGAPLLLVAAQRLGAPLERRSGSEQARAAQAASLATDLIRGLRVLKGIGADEAAAQRYAAASAVSLRATLRAARAEALYDAATTALTVVLLALVALIGGRLAAGGAIEVGELVAAVGLAQFLLGPLSQLSSTGAALARARASATRVAAILAAHPPVAAHPVGASLVEGGPAEADAGVVVGADGIGLLIGPALRIEPGEFVGVAAGVADAAAVVEELAAGAHDGLLVARHDDVLFAQSLLENIRDGARAAQRPAAERDRLVERAIIAADVDQVIAALPDGAQTEIGEAGLRLSGGQRQRIALARALSADAPALVLHDPTTAVDASTEARIAAGLRSMRAGRATVLLTTSPALLAVCDRVVLIADRRVRATGSHAQLAARDAGYRELVFA